MLDSFTGGVVRYFYNNFSKEWLDGSKSDDGRWF